MRSVAEVAAEHAALVRALPADGVAVLNADDAHAGVWRDAARGHARASSTSASTMRRRCAGAIAPARWRQRCSTSRRRRARPTVALAVAGPAQRCAMRSPRRRRRSRRRAARGDRARARGVPARAPAGCGRAQAATACVVIDDTLQRQSGFGARGDRRARRAAPAPTWLVLGDMGEVGDAGAGVPREIGEYARAAASTACSPPATLRGRRARGVRRRRASISRRSRRWRARLARERARRRHGAGQGLALHADGARRRGARRRRAAEGRTDAALARRTGWRRTCARSTSSATSRCARCWRR